MSAVYRNLVSMGTRMDMVFHGIDEEMGDDLYSLLSKEVLRLDNMLSNYNISSSVSVLNSASVLDFFTPETEVFDLVKTLDGHSEATLNYFDYLASSDPENAGKNKVKYMPIFSRERKGLIEFRNSDKSIRIHSSAAYIQTGAFGKGYALDRLKSILKNFPVSNAFISFGESSVMATGNHPWGEGWKISLPDIFTGKGLFELTLKDQSLSVSGNTPANLKKYPGGHIYNPNTGRIISDLGIISVTGPSAFVAEILSTALFASQDTETGKHILNKYPEYKAVSISYKGTDSPPVITEL